MRTIAIISILTTTVVMACDKPAPEIVFVTAEPAAVTWPSACTSPDPKWSKLPDSDVRKSDIPRNDEKNKTNYTEILGKRDVCRAAHLAQQKRG